jgi:hypothetical protein
MAFPTWLGWYFAVELVGLLALLLLLACLYLRMIQETMNRCSPESRVMNPALVWLDLIPGFGTLWHFVIVGALGLTLLRESRRGGLSSRSMIPGTGIGLVASVVGLVLFLSVGRSLIEQDPEKLTGWAIAAGIPCWFAYWAFVARHHARLAFRNS